MLRSLFARLTDAPKRGEALFEFTVTEARRPHWFSEGEVPDTVEGRFSMLATVVALLIIRLEQAGSRGEAASVALSERFVESMDAEIRQMGVNDPTLGRQVRQLVGALAVRIERWRSAIAGREDWLTVAMRSVYRDRQPDSKALAHSGAALRDFWLRLEATDVELLSQGRLR